MQGQDNCSQPVFQLRLDGFDVIVRFRAEDTCGVKDRIRDILTKSYEERIMEDLSETNDEQNGEK